MMTIKTLCVIVIIVMVETVLGMDRICRTKHCPVPFKTLGCYKDSMGDRVLPNYIYNERDPTTSNYGNRKIEWYNWEIYLAEFACRCASRAQAQGYDLFSVQFYGECWAGHSNTHNYKRLGSTEKCVGDHYKPCTASDRYCSGEQESNFVYQIIPGCNLQYERIGCFRDAHTEGQRPLANYVLNDRDSTIPNYSGQTINWENFDVYLPEFACRCANKAQENGSTYFGLQFYGECWTHPDGDKTYGRDGRTDAQCVNNCYKSCDDRPDASCVGQQFSNYVYRIKVSGQPSCDVAIESIGCYKENTADRALSVELVNTNPPSRLFYGQMAVSGEWSAFFPGFLCKCAHEAKLKGWAYFGVSDFGACYSDAASESYSRHSSSSECGEGAANSACAAGSMACAGTNKNANYVYKITLPSSSSKRSFIPAKDPFKKGFKDFEF